MSLAPTSRDSTPTRFPQEALRGSDPLYATSPDRYGFLIENYKKRLARNPDNAEIKRTLEFYEKLKSLDGLDQALTDDLSYDLRKCDWIVEKCKTSDTYSQNLYAALCNNSFFKNGKEWHCSWRSCAGLVAHLREEGDYINWYCSGIPAEWNLPVRTGFVGEGTITEEVVEDLKKIGWIPAESTD